MSVLITVSFLLDRKINQKCNLSEANIFEQLKELLVNELLIDPDDITLDAELSSDLGISSVDLADLVCQCEERFGLEIDDADIPELVHTERILARIDGLLRLLRPIRRKE